MKQHIHPIILLQRCRFPMLLVILLMVQSSILLHSQENGRQLWFTAQKPAVSSDVLTLPDFYYLSGQSPVKTIIRDELRAGLSQLYGKQLIEISKPKRNAFLYLAKESNELMKYVSQEEISGLGTEGYLIKCIPEQNTIVVYSNKEIGWLYGTYAFMRFLKTATSTDLSHPILLKESPLFTRRILNHWDNLDGSVERGYAGHSIWRWDQLPDTVSSKYKEYARANASIGINGTVLNNVNADPFVLTTENLKKVQVIADQMRPYGIKVYLSVNFASPQVVGRLSTSHPHNDSVKNWWSHKVAEIYALMPDFGGFLVKANSEGQPGPMDYDCSHADGANMLATALEPFHGIVMWRAFVYEPKGDDRAKEAYNEFKPLDGTFKSNVIIQVKNGPIDFQPREPFSPLFGGMHHTKLMPELQITQEYLGFSDHLVYLAPLFKEFLSSQTYFAPNGATVAEVCDGTINNESITAIAGVANIGNDMNWCGHHFAQANWYAFGRLAWNHTLSASAIAKEWLYQTFNADSAMVNALTDVMLRSREAAVSYMTPLGLHHLMGWDHHYGPEPWCDIPNARPDWLPRYYHKADSIGLGFDRSTKGSNAVSQYNEPLRSQYDNINTCPEKFILWFHHVDWNHTMKSGRTLWNELCHEYTNGVKEVEDFRKVWLAMKDDVDAQRWLEVKEKLDIQWYEANWWRDACLLYFREFSRQPFPQGIKPPTKGLEELKKQSFDKSHKSIGY